MTYQAICNFGSDKMMLMERSGSTLEIEVKLRVVSADQARALLGRLPATPDEGRLFEDNEIYDTPDGTLRQAHRLLRLRIAGHRGLITYKEKVDTDLHAKVRAEIQTEVESPDAARAILLKLGFVRVYRYQKHRSCFVWTDPGGSELAISLDETPIGVYLELEGPAPVIDRAAGRMGFTRTDYILDDYHSLHQSWLEQEGLPEGDMVFVTPQTGPDRP